MLSTETMAFKREGPEWMKIGFQRENPDTDFRGGGMLALKCLVYASTMHGDKVGSFNIL